MLWQTILSLSKKKPLYPTAYQICIFHWRWWLLWHLLPHYNSKRLFWEKCWKSELSWARCVVYRHAAKMFWYIFSQMFQYILKAQRARVAVDVIQPVERRQKLHIHVTKSFSATSFLFSRGWYFEYKFSKISNCQRKWAGRDGHVLWKGPRRRYKIRISWHGQLLQLWTCTNESVLSYYIQYLCNNK